VAESDWRNHHRIRGVVRVIHGDDLMPTLRLQLKRRRVRIGVCALLLMAVSSIALSDALDFPRFRGHLSAWVERPGQGGSSAQIEAAVSAGVSS
jgi:hypothetical protein